MLTIRGFKSFLLTAGAVAFACFQLAASPLEETVNVLQEWVETERRISQAEAEWETNKASMKNLISIYGGEIDMLTELIEAAEEDISAAERRRAELLSQDESVKEIEAKVVEVLVAAEKEVRELRALLPLPLQEELSPLFNAIPRDPAATRLSIGQRIQPLVAILTQVQRFNQVVTVVEGYRAFEEGRTVQTETVYFGLGAAYYVDTADEHAGVGVLGPDGWSWKDDDTLVAEVRNFIDIYRGTKQASYVQLPLNLN
jgi:hypothetical protein